MILLQRRYNALYELKRLTEELLDAGERGDAVTVQLILQMRADEMSKVEDCQGQIWRLAKVGTEEGRTLRWLMSQKFLSEPERKDKTEEKVWALRTKTQTTIDQLQHMDRQFNLRAAGAKSYYR